MTLFKKCVKCSLKMAQLDDCDRCLLCLGKAHSFSDCSALQAVHSKGSLGLGFQAESSPLREDLAALGKDFTTSKELNCHPPHSFWDQRHQALYWPHFWLQINPVVACSASRPTKEISQSIRLPILAPPNWEQICPPPINPDPFSDS